MLLATLLLSTAVAVLCLVVVGVLAHRVTTQTARHVAQCSTIASELASSLARSRKLETRVAELDDLCERTQESMHKLRSRAGMSARRAADAEQETLTGAAWKDKMRKQLQLTQKPVAGGSISAE